MATPSYKERMRAARAEASAKRKAEQAARQRQIELRCEVHRLALAAVKAGIQAKGQRKLSTYSPGRADDDGQCVDRALVYRAGAGVISASDSGLEATQLHLRIREMRQSTKPSANAIQKQ